MQLRTTLFMFLAAFLSCLICRNLTLPLFKKYVFFKNGYFSATRSISVVMKEVCFLLNIIFANQSQPKLRLIFWRNCFCCQQMFSTGYFRRMSKDNRKSFKIHSSARIVTCTNILLCSRIFYQAILVSELYWLHGCIAPKHSVS